MKKYYFLVLFISFVLLVISCDGTMDSTIENKLIYGTWNWILSVKWRSTKTPETLGYTKQIIFSYPNSYQEKRDGILITTSQFTIKEEFISTTFHRANVLTIADSLKYTFEFDSNDTLILYPLFCDDCDNYIIYERIE